MMPSSRALPFANQMAAVDLCGARELKGITRFPATANATRAAIVLLPTATGAATFPRSSIKIALGVAEITRGRAAGRSRPVIATMRPARAVCRKYAVGVVDPRRALDITVAAS